MSDPCIFTYDYDPQTTFNTHQIKTLASRLIYGEHCGKKRGNKKSLPLCIMLYNSTGLKTSNPLFFGLDLPPGIHYALEKEGSKLARQDGEDQQQVGETEI
jgi:hypothetical protein